MSAIDTAVQMAQQMQDNQAEDVESTAYTPPAEYTEAEGADQKHKPLDDNANMVIRSANILDPRRNYKDSSIDVLDISGVVNDSNGKVCVAWDDLPGGVIRPNASGKKYNEPSSYNAEDRTHNQIHNTSNAETIPLTYPFLWNGSTNWCGFNYLPPVGAKTLIGWRKGNEPTMLGYLATNYRHMEPPLHPGEVMIKGFGDNYIYNRWSNKIDLRCHANKGDQDLDDSSGSKSANADCECKIAIDADNGFIDITVNGTGIHITADGITQVVKGSSISMDENNLTFVAPKAITNNTSTMNNNYGEANNNK